MPAQRIFPAPAITNANQARSFFAPWFAWANNACETVCVAHLDQDGHCVHFMQRHGSRSNVWVPLREIVADAIEHHTAAMVIAHNHPSGDPSPSDCDCRATRRLVTVVDALGCSVLDHLVFASPHCTSFRELGLL